MGRARWLYAKVGRSLRQRRTGTGNRESRNSDSSSKVVGGSLVRKEIDTMEAQYWVSSAQLGGRLHRWAETAPHDATRQPAAV